MNLAFRRATERDLAYVVASWLDSYKLAHAAGLIAVEDWDDIMGAQFRKYLARPAAEVHVAFNPAAAQGELDVHGWLALERRGLPTILYCYVKQSYRRLGIARGLLRVAGIDPAARFAYACKTGVVSELRGVISGGRFDPIDVRFPPK